MYDCKCWIAKVDVGMGIDVQHEGISLNIFFDGCSMEPHCHDCHNPDLWERHDVYETDVNTVIEDLHNHSDIASHVAFMGGEPLDQPKALFLINRAAKEIGYKTWLYTGHYYAHIPLNLRKEFDVMVCGRYDHTQYNPLGFPASLNQQVIRYE